jgi:hypothetical protein
MWLTIRAFWLLRWAMCGGALTLAACGAANGDSPSVSPSATPEQICAQRCQLQVAPSCERTPTDYLSACTVLCLAKYTQHATCMPMLRALDVCSIERVHYDCEDGIVHGTPTGACANEGASCINCTGDLMGCL